METTTDHRKLAEIGRVRIYGTKFHNLPKDARVRVANRLGDKINADTLKAAIDEAKAAEFTILKTSAVGKSELAGDILRKMENGK